MHLKYYPTATVPRVALGAETHEDRKLLMRLWSILGRDGTDPAVALTQLLDAHATVYGESEPQTAEVKP